MSPELRSLAPARPPSSNRLSNRWFRFGIAFTLLHIAVAWAAFSYDAYDAGPAPVGASVPSEGVSVGPSGADRVEAASASVGEAIDLLYAELPLRMSDGEWRRDVSSSCMLLSARALELDTVLPDDPEAAQLRGVLLDMSETAEELRVAVQDQSPEAAQLAVDRMNRCVEAWAASTSDVDAE